MYIFGHISLSSFYNEKFSNKFVEKIETNVLCVINFF